MPAPPGRRVLPGLAVLALYLAGSFAMVASTWLRHRSGWIAGDGDPQLIMWDLGWTPFALTHHQSPLLTDYLVYPAQINLMWNTSDIAPSLLMWPVTAIFGPIAGYNVLTTLAPALSAFCAYLALGRYSGRLGAAAGGLLYGFSPYVIAQLGGHLHASLAVFPPLALLALDELLVRQRHPPILVGALLGVAFSAQLLTGIELLATTALMTAVATVLLVALHPRAALARARHAATGLVAAGATAAVLCAYPLWVALYGPNRVRGPVQTPDTYVTDLLGLVTPSLGQHFHTAGAIATQLRFTGNMSEQNAYLGYPLIALIAVILVALRRRPPVLWSFLVLVAALVLSMGPHLHIDGRMTGLRLPWYLVERISVFQAALPGRMAVFAFLMCGLLVASAVDALVAARSHAWRAAGLLAVALGLLPLLPAGSVTSTDPENPPFFTTGLVRQIPEGSVALVLPYAVGAKGILRAHLWQSESSFRFRMAEGLAIRPRSAGGPAEADLYASMIQLELEGYPVPGASDAARLRSDLSRLRVRTVIVGPGEDETAEVRFFQVLLNQRPALVGGVDLFVMPVTSR